jgi:hypothetical protein
MINCNMLKKILKYYSSDFFMFFNPVKIEFKYFRISVRKRIFLYDFFKIAQIFLQSPRKSPSKNTFEDVNP